MGMGEGSLGRIIFVERSTVKIKFHKDYMFEMCEVPDV